MKTAATPAPLLVPDPAALRQALLAARADTLKQLYRQAFPAVRRLVQRHGGTAQDAQDVFHDALIVLYEKAVANTLVLTASPGTYLVSVSRNLWLQEQARRRRTGHLGLAPEHSQVAADEAAPPLEEAAAAVLGYVAQLGVRCQQLLLAFYYFQQPLAQIAPAQQYGSVRSATVQKFKCLERLRKSMRVTFADHFTH